MTERKPPGVSSETWIDKQIRESMARGEFDNLPGAGKPIADVDQPYDELWWVRQKLKRENVSFLPPTLALRKEAQDTRAAAVAARSEAQALQLVTAVNEKIRDAIRKPLEGPPLNLMPFDVEKVMDDWRVAHAPPAEPAGAAPPVTTPADQLPSRPSRRRWIPRRRRAVS